MTIWASPYPARLFMVGAEPPRQLGRREVLLARNAVQRCFGCDGRLREDLALAAPLCGRQRDLFACVLRALGEVGYEGDIFVEEGDFHLGIKNILSTLESALNMHRKYGNHLPMYAMLTDEHPPEEDQS